MITTNAVRASPAIPIGLRSNRQSVVKDRPLTVCQHQSRECVLIARDRAVEDCDISVGAMSAPDVLPVALPFSLDSLNFTQSALTLVSVLGCTVD